MREVIKRAARAVGVDLGSVKGSLRRGFRAIRYFRGASAGWYDEAYRSSEEYSQHYADSIYLPVWDEISDRIEDGSTVLEIGCGSGQLAHLLIDRHMVDYTGFDFSPAAIEIARRRLPAVKFLVDDARTTALVEQVSDVVLCTEVLEHIREDLTVLRRIPSGRRVLATVPDFESETHLRWFDSESGVRDRYESAFESLDVKTVVLPTGGRFFVMDGTRA